MDVNVCRVCMINSEVFEYCNLMEKIIFKNIRLCDAFKLITGLDVSNDKIFTFDEKKWLKFSPKLL